MVLKLFLQWQHITLSSNSSLWFSNKEAEAKTKVHTLQYPIDSLKEEELVLFTVVVSCLFTLSSTSALLFLSLLLLLLLLLLSERYTASRGSILEATTEVVALALFNDP